MVGLNDPRVTAALGMGARVPARRQQRQIVPMRAVARPNAITLDQLQQRYVQQQKQQENSRSLFDQITDAVTGLPKGVGKLLWNTGVETIAPARIGLDFARGDLSIGDMASVGGYGGVAAAAGGPQNGDLFRRYRPMTADTSQSMQNTAGNLRHPSRYLKAIDEGRIVDTIMEDAGNISLFAGPATKAFRAGSAAAEGAGRAGLASGLDRAARVSERVSTIGGAVSDAPISLARGGLRRVGGVAARGFEKALAAEGALGDAARTMQTRQGLRLTPEGRVAAVQTAKGHRLGQRAFSRVQRDLFDASTAAGGTALEGATLASMNGVAHVDQLAQDIARGKGLNLTPEDIRRMHVLENKPEQTYTADVQQAFAATQNDPALAAQMAANRDRVQPVLDRLQDSAIAGEGRKPLDQAQLGNEAIDGYVGKALTEAGYSIDDVNSLMELRMEGRSWTDIAEMVPELADILNDPMVYPSRWRPMMLSAKRINSAANESGPFGLGLPVRPADMLAAGLPEPQYLPGGRSGLVDPKSYKLGQEPVNQGMRGYQAVGADQARVASEIQPYSFRALADKAGGTLRTVEFNKALVEFVRSDKLLDVTGKLDQQVLADADAMALQAADAMMNKTIDGSEATRTGRPTMAQRESLAYREAYGNAIIEALKEKGYEIFAGNKNDPQAGDFNPDMAIAPSEVTADALVLPIGVKARLVQRTVGKNLNPPLQVLRYINTKFKGAVLPFSLRWHLGDLVGGAFMGWVGGGIPPWELVDNMRQLKELSPDAMESIMRHPEFIDSGLSFEESRWRVDGEQAKQPRTPIGKIQRKSFKANETINRVNRQGYVLAKTQRLLDDMGLDLESVDSTGAWDTPEVQNAIHEAVADANKVMGTFDELTPFEQRWMKNIFPFYVWSRHITMLAMRTAVDNPARIVWTMRLGAYGANADEDLPEWLKGAIRVPDAVMPDFIAEGDAYVPTSFLNPFNDVVGNPAFTPQGITRALSPGLKIPLAGAFGVEPGNSFAQPLRPITRPYGEERNWFGDTLAAGLRTFPISRELQYQAPTGTIGGLSFGPHPRYSSGRNMVDSNGDPIDTNPRSVSALRLLGLPVPTQASDAEAIQESARARARVRSKKRKKVVLG